MPWLVLIVAVVCLTTLVGLRWRLDASTPTFEIAVSGVLESKLRDEVVVSLKTGETFKGVLFEHDERALVLRDAVSFASESTVRAVDGELVVLWGDVAYLQRP